MQENLIIYSGHLGRDAEVYATKDGNELVSLSIAYTTKSKNGTDRTTWLPVKVFGKELAAKAALFKKGENVFIKGKIESREWNDKETGAKRSSLEVWAYTCAKIPKETGFKPAGFVGGEVFEKAPKNTTSLPYKDDDLENIPF